MSNKITDYFALASESELPQEISEVFERYLQDLSSTGQARKMQLSYAQYYNIKDLGGFRLEQDPRNPSLTRISANLYRNTIQHVLQVICQDKIAFEARATNTDDDTLESVDVAKHYLDHIQEKKNISGVMREATEKTLVMYDSFIFLPFDMTKGVDVRPDETGRMIKTGEQTFQVLSAYDVARDLTQSQENDWYIIRRPVNKYNFAKLYPNVADTALSESSVSEKSAEIRLRNFTLKSNEDNIFVYHFFHSRTALVPNGIEALIVGDKCVYRKELSYETIPIVRLSAGDILETSIGYNFTSDMMPLQEGFSKLLTAVTTNQMNLAITNVQSAEDVSIKKIAEGMNLFKTPGEIKALNLAQSSPETYSLINLYMQLMDRVSGQNDVMRGNPPEGVSAASALGLLQASAISFTSTLQQAYARACSEVGTILINNAKRKLSAPLLVSITGKSKASSVMTIKADQLKPIDTVTVALSNPVQNSYSGKIQQAEDYVSKGFIKNPQQYAMVRETGNVDILTEPYTQKEHLMNRENEILRKGGAVAALITEDHRAHADKHLSLLADPILKADPVVVQAVMDHVQEHIDLERSMPPDLKAFLSGQPLPPPEAPPSSEARPPMENLPPGAPDIAAPPLPDTAPQQSVNAYEQQVKPTL